MRTIRGKQLSASRQVQLSPPYSRPHWHRCKLQRLQCNCNEFFLEKAIRIVTLRKAIARLAILIEDVLGTTLSHKGKLSMLDGLCCETLSPPGCRNAGQHRKMGIVSSYVCVLYIFLRPDNSMKLIGLARVFMHDAISNQ